MSSQVEDKNSFGKLGFIFSSCIGVSNRPLIWAGQHWLAIAPLDDEPQLGDILVFKSREDEKMHIVHRLIEIDDSGKERVYITRGDNCLTVERVPRDIIIGRVAEVHRVSGFRPWHAIWKKKFTVNDPAYLHYVRFWKTIWPIRKIFYRLRVLPYAFANKLKRLF